MKNRIMFIERKTHANHKGDAWIAEVEFSKSGQTIYFNNQAFKKLKKGGIVGNYYNLESKNEYWISGVKKNQTDRYNTGCGKIKLDRSIIGQYLSLVENKTIDPASFEIVDLQKIEKSRFIEIENSKKVHVKQRKKIILAKE